MGGLAHYMEEEGLATTQISLIHEHTEIIKPPRALWVPFELGRPFGVPDNPDFQTKILECALELLNAPGGPILEEFPEEAPPDDSEVEVLACPVNFAGSKPEGEKDDFLVAAFQLEMSQMRNWYDLAVEQRGRTTAVTTGLVPEEIAEFLTDFIRGSTDTSPVENVSLATALRMAAEDLKAYYMEAVTAQPGQPTASTTLSNWFWSQTRAAQMIDTVRRICLDNSDPEFQLLGKLLLVPRAQLHNFNH